MNNTSKTQKLVEAAILLGLATVLSLYKLIDLPYGGSVTIASMLPIVILSYRHGLGWGLMGGLAFGAIQQLLGLNTLSYVTTWQSILAVVLLDYIVAFAVTGLGGIFRGKTRQPAALALGALLVCLLRYVCHVISGATVWAGLSIPTNAALLYSFGYNATYMVPETIVTMVIAYYIGSLLDFSNTPITRYSGRNVSAQLPVYGWLAGLVLVAGAVFDARAIFTHLQNAETGDFYFNGISSVNWTLVSIVTVIAVVLAIVLLFIQAKKKEA